MSVYLKSPTNIEQLSEVHQAHTSEFLAALLHETSNRQAYDASGYVHSDDLAHDQARCVLTAIKTVARDGIDAGQPDRKLATIDVHDRLLDEGHLANDATRMFWVNLAAPGTGYAPSAHRLKQLGCRLAEDRFRQLVGTIYTYDDAHVAPLTELTTRMARDRETMLEVFARTGHRAHLSIVIDEEKGA